MKIILTNFKFFITMKFLFNNEQEFQKYMRICNSHFATFMKSSDYYNVNVKRFRFCVYN